MPYEQKDNEIVLFANDKKRTDRDPNARGQGRVNGVDVWANAWTNTAKSGVKYQTIRLTPKEEAAMDQRTQHSEEPPVDSDNIPF